MWRGRNRGMAHSCNLKRNSAVDSLQVQRAVTLWTTRGRRMDPVELACLQDFLTTSFPRCDGIFAVSIGPPFGNRGSDHQWYEPNAWYPPFPFVMPAKAGTQSLPLA